MPFEGSHSDSGTMQSPGGFEFGVQGWVWGSPVPKNITFFLDNTAMVCDQYGRQIRRALLNDGSEVRFADTPPEGSTEGTITARPQFASHIKTIEALRSEGFDWMLHNVNYVQKDGSRRARTKLTIEQALSIQTKLIQEGNRLVSIERTVECVGWPQLPYEHLKKLPVLPPTPIDDLARILDPQLRKDAVRIKVEEEEARTEGLPTYEEDEE